MAQRRQRTPQESTADLRSLRKALVTAIGSDDELFSRLVLKGGNAIDLVYLEGSRVSLDIDYSVEGDYPDRESLERRLCESLTKRLELIGLRPFDFRFRVKPPDPPLDPRLSGFDLEFKVVATERYEVLVRDPRKLRDAAIPIDATSNRTFVIQISKHEHCAGSTTAVIDGQSIRIYTPIMIVGEKLRAICQSLSGYRKTERLKPRARDFYDITRMVEKFDLDLSQPDSADTISAIFAAKDVSLSLLPEIRASREQHRLDWPAVVSSAGEVLDGADYDYYFDNICRLAVVLESLRHE